MVNVNSMTRYLMIYFDLLCTDVYQINQLTHQLDQIKQAKWNAVKYGPVTKFTVIPDVPRNRILQLICGPVTVHVQ